MLLQPQPLEWHFFTILPAPPLRTTVSAVVVVFAPGDMSGGVGQPFQVIFITLHYITSQQHVLYKIVVR